MASVAQPPESIMRVEEDWVLVEPDGDVLAPQFHTLMSPFIHLDSFYAQVTWNYWELPEFEPAMNGVETLFGVINGQSETWGSFGGIQVAYLILFADRR